MFVLLVCHGAFGYAHQVEPPDAALTHDGHSAGGMAGHGGGSSGVEHSLGGGYFATLLALLLGTFVSLVARISPGVWLRVPRLSRWRVPSVVLHPPRGPTVPMLGVFRL